MTRKEAAMIMKTTYQKAAQWNEKAIKEYVEAKIIYKQRVKEQNETRK